MNKKEVFYLVGVALTAMAWINYAEHPTARNLKRALISSLSL